jgi:tRNA nucleotidyltransferase (CCA-adding enzyme)
MTVSVKKVLDSEIERIRVSDEEISYLKNLTNLVIGRLNKKIEKKGIMADVFVGGSLAKDTLIKKSKYDVDLFVRFSKKYSEEEINKYMRKLFFWFRVPGQRIRKKRIHGSRDYYRIDIKSRKGFSFEVVPTVKVNDPKNARNITDLSFFHVNYIRSKASSQKIVDQILLAKSFCHAQKCYGAESYVNGFSGYSIEILVSHYKDFKKFLMAMIKAEDQLIIDPGKLYKSKKEIIDTLSKAKLQGPLVLIDPTFRDRNASNALSKETFDRFRLSARAFLKEPNYSFFEHKRVDIPYFRSTAQDVRGIFAVLEINTKKQAGDIAGSKMLKFSKVLTREMEKYFDVIEHEYDYWGAQKSNVYYVLKRKTEIIHHGPSVHNTEAAQAFKRKHRIWYEEEGRVKSAKPTDLSIREFLKEFNRVHKRTVKQMGIKGVRLV